ncbi:restriction endonuclease subunit S [Enterococcus thailandicus]|uniref:restriction endonuclease subunit S n=1 Tax=Enterococcus thailandicus TaxID=417368 RepID=UPI002890C459|nr:restriction endonuclease subunit S [Enterococcus thailandicus]MDT2733108.1 restriction endonuclease subunit S [Enterococcus thailandicus]
MVDKKVPELRFEGFDGDWEQRKVGEVFSERSERSGEGELISVTINSGVVKASELDRKDNSSDDKSNYKKVEVGDIAYNSMRMWQGASGYSPYNGILSPAYTVIIPKKDIDSKFFAYDFKRYDMIQTFKRNSQGLTSDTWNLKFPTLKSVKVMVPSIEEQKQISTFFESLDTTITLHQQKLDQLKRLKQGFLQILFGNKEQAPKVRFAGFDEEWEQRKLGEVVQITMGQSPNSEYYTENPLDHILVQGNADMKNNRVVPRVWTTQVTKQAEKGDLILSVRAPVGDIGITDYDVVLGRGVAAIKGNDFIFQQLVKMKKEGFWNRFSTGSTFESINSNDIKEALITIPNGDEQKSIGSFFANLDTTIALHQTKLEKLKQLKKGFLQSMFI